MRLGQGGDTSYVSQELNHLALASVDCKNGQDSSISSDDRGE